MTTAGVLGMAELGRCRVMGVLNVTPDSFSDGGDFLDADAAIAHGLEMLRDGADIIDVGGESTRPGAGRVPPEEERRRIEPVVRALAEAGAVVSIDTMRASTAEVALAAGAAMVNDVSGGLDDPALPKLVATAEVPYVVMHWRGPSADMQQRAQYGDVVRDVVDELRRQVDAVVSAGVDIERIVVDPGIGFAKTAAHNWALLHDLSALDALARPLLVGVSRKSFLGSLLADDDGAARPFAGRDDATTAITALAAAAGVWAIRVHAVRPSADAVRVAAAWRAGAAPQ